MRTLAIAILASLCAFVSSQPAGFVVTDQITALNQPTCIEFAPNGNLWVGLKPGTIQIYSGSTLVSTFGNIACTSNSERGVLGLALDPNFTTNHYVYVYYTTSASSLNPPATPKNRVSRFTELNNTILPGSETILIDNIPSDAGNHNAGCIRFGLDAKLYVATGDGGSTPSNSQNLNNLAGKILRINPDGTIPADNPYFGDTSKRQEILFYGLRNPFRFEFRPGTNVIYVADVGQNTWEEVNVGLPAGNFGWPIHEGTTGASGFVNPIHEYNHNGGNASITGGCFVGTRWPVEYQNRYIFGDYVLDTIRYLTVNASNQALNNGTFGPLGGPVDFALGPDGALYVASISTGSIKRIAYRPRVVNLSTPTTVYGGNSETVGVNLDHAAPAAGQTVTLSSSDPGVLQVPTSMQVGAGLTSGSFTYTTTGVATNTPVVITASAGGANATANITVLKANLAEMTFNPNVVYGGNSSVATLTLNGKAPAGGLDITLSSGNPTLAQVPANLIINAGSGSGQFTITTIPVTAQQVVSITATLGAQSLARTFTIRQAEYLVMSLTLNPSSIESGKNSSGRITINKPAGVGGQPVNVLDNASVVTVPPVVTVPQGGTFVNFTINTSAIDTTINVNIQARIGNSIRNATLTLLPCPIKSIGVFPATIAGGLSANGQVVLRATQPSGASVLLSDNSNYVSVPALVNIPSGGTTANFVVGTSPVGTNVIATVSATFQGAVRRATMTVTNQVALLSLTVSPTSVTGSSNSIGTITLTKITYPSNFTVNVSDNMSIIGTPATVTVLANQKTRTFTITTSAVTATYTGTIIASANGITRTATLTVHP
jgi:glucose/arabinose dehydrogenase